MISKLLSGALLAALMIQCSFLMRGQSQRPRPGRLAGRPTLIEIVGQLGSPCRPDLHICRADWKCTRLRVLESVSPASRLLFAIALLLPLPILTISGSIWGSAGPGPWNPSRPDSWQPHLSTSGLQFLGLSGLLAQHSWLRLDLGRSDSFEYFDLGSVLGIDSWCKPGDCICGNCRGTSMRWRDSCH